MKPPFEQPALNRTLTLPYLLFYGLGVTIGAGIFALIGQVLALAGDRAPQSFLLAALIAGATGVSYAILIRIYPRAGGEAVFVGRGMGKVFGLAAGLGVVVTAIVSSATISLAFAGYAGTLLPVPPMVLVAGLVAILALVAWWGVRESVILAAVITILETGTLVLVAAFGLPRFVTPETIAMAFSPPTTLSAISPVLAGTILAFFAFIGFEDIVNMAEETREPERTVPRAVLWTLALTLFLYLAIALVAISIPGRDAVSSSSAPMATLFELATGWPGGPISAMASIAMVNGVLVQIIMAARVLYGMANEGQMPGIFGRVDPIRRTPVFSTAFVAALILVLALTVPLVSLAEVTSIVTIAVFAMVNFSLFRLGSKEDDPWARRMRWWGMFAALLCVVILAWQASTLF